jgi:hypothetical protein
MSKTDYSTTANQEQYPKIRELSAHLEAAGFRFDLEYPRRKHQGLIVYHQGEILPPGVRFPVMQAAIRDRGIPTRQGDIGLAARRLAWMKHGMWRGE